MRPRTGRGQSAAASRSVAWRDAGLALLLATGLSTVFLAPIRPVATTPVTPLPTGRVLGASTTVPLVVTVVVSWPDGEHRVIVQPRHGLLAEALSAAAAQLDATFTYTSRGSSQYLQYFRPAADRSEQIWTVAVNGKSVIDLSAESLSQGDTITIQ